MSEEESVTSKPMERLESEARWYCIDRDGMAIPCIDEDDAKDMAAESFVRFPHEGPYVVVQMVAAASVDAAVVAERERCLYWCALGDHEGYATDRIRDGSAIPE